MRRRKRVRVRTVTRSVKWGTPNGPGLDNVPEIGDSVDSPLEPTTLPTYNYKKKKQFRTDNNQKA